MALLVKFWGTRGSIPTPGPRTQRYGGNTSCVEIRTDATLAICDGGTGLRELGEDLLERDRSGPLTLHMFFSHPHWDHIQGFPFFAPAYAPANRLLIYGAHNGDEHIHSLLSGQMRSSYFPVDFGDLGAQIVARACGPDPTPVGDLHVRSFQQKHPGGSVGYRFEHGDVSVVYATDNELDLLLEDPARAQASPEALRTLPAAGVAPIRGADLLIADAQYTDAEYSRKVGWGHPRASTVVDLAVQAQVKRLALHHHDPMQSDDDVEAKVAHCAKRARRHGSKLEVFAAREGVELKL